MFLQQRSNVRLQKRRIMFFESIMILTLCPDQIKIKTLLLESKAVQC